MSNEFERGYEAGKEAAWLEYQALVRDFEQKYAGGTACVHKCSSWLCAFLRSAIHGRIRGSV